MVQAIINLYIPSQFELNHSNVMLQYCVFLNPAHILI